MCIADFGTFHAETLANHPGWVCVERNRANEVNKACLNSVFAFSREDSWINLVTFVQASVVSYRLLETPM